MKCFPACIYAAVVFLVANTARSQVPGQAAHSAAQTRLLEADSSTVFIITLKDGSTFSGRVRTVRDDSLVFVSSAGILTIPVTDVRKSSVVREQDLRNGEYWFPNANRTRLLFGPTGRMLKADEGYFSIYELFLPGIAYGVSSDFTIGGGMSFLPGLSPAEQLLYFTPKVGLISSDNLNVAVGALAMRASELSLMGVLFGVSTFGGENSSVTIGVGYGYGNGEISETPIIMLGGEHRVSARVGLVTENHFLDGADWHVLMLGVRFFGESMAFDAGVMRPSVRGDGAAFPYVGFVVNF